MVIRGRMQEIKMVCKRFFERGGGIKRYIGGYERMEAGNKKVH